MEIAFSQLATAARELDAILVEPDIKNGRLVPKGSLPMSHFFERAFLQDFLEEGRGKLATRQEFETFQKDIGINNITTIHMCFRKCSGGEGCNKRDSGVNPPCYERKIVVLPDGTTSTTSELVEIPGDYQQSYSMSLEKAIQARASGQNVILRIHNYWKNSLHNMRYSATATDSSNHNNNNKTLLPLVDRQAAIVFEKTGLEFTQPLHDAVTTILRQYSIENDNYAAIHWRGEIMGMDYLECAKAIVDVRAQMNLLPDDTNYDETLASQNNNKNITSHPPVPVFLVSSIMSDTSLEWEDGRPTTTNSSAPEALNLLTNIHHFHRVEANVKELFASSAAGVVDVLHYTVTDLLLASRAKYFSTCTRQCAKTDYCAKCNLLGHFAGNLHLLRQIEGKQSSACWNLPLDYKPIGR